MAFNPFVTFQRNRRFWMAAILMICMVSFVFCTGLKGDMAERLQWMISGRGDTAFKLDGRSYSSKQVNDLRQQRKLADKVMVNASDMAFKKLQKVFFELTSKNDQPLNAKEEAERKQKLTQIQGARESIAVRKARPHYFDIGTKFDDLVEFAVWQNIADKLGIRLEEDHVKELYFREFYGVLELHELAQNEQYTLRDFRDSGPDSVRRALIEEFRVRIAQEAYMTGQPAVYFTRGRQSEGIGYKFAIPELPDEIRAPLTFAQLWEEYKKNRAEFDVTLLPVTVPGQLAKIKNDPTPDEKAKYYADYFKTPVDPASDVRGLLLNQKFKIEYVLADPKSPAFLDSAKLVERLKSTNPLAPEAVISPLAALTRLWAAKELQTQRIQDHYDALSAPTDRLFYLTTPVGVKDVASPAMSWFARRYPEAAVTLLASSAISQVPPITSVASFMAWGAVKHPEELELTLIAESKRRAPHYASLIGVALADPLASTGAYIALEVREGHPRWGYPRLPLEAVQKELEEMIVARAAEEQAQQNMQIVRTALEKVDGDAEKFKRELNQLVPELKLTYGPPADKKNVYYSRHTLDSAEELKVLKDAYLKYYTQINFFEGRDLTPGKQLTADDYYKMYFDSAEIFAATAMHRAMPWPPRVKANSARLWKKADPRLELQIDPRASAAFAEHLKGQNPLAPTPVFDDLFKNASSPILFWRTAKRDPATLPLKFDELEVTVEKDGKKITKDGTALEALVTEWNKNEESLKKLGKLQAEIEGSRKEWAALRKAKANENELRKLSEKVGSLQDSYKKMEEDLGAAAYLRNRQVAIKEDEADYREVVRLVTEGWKFERARTNEALPEATRIANELIEKGFFAIPEKDKENAINVPRMCRMFPEDIHGNTVEYGKPPLPKDKILFPRDNMIDELVSLQDLTDGIKTGNKELDDINSKLYNRVKEKYASPIGNYVQILTNKPRSVYYVAFVSRAPVAKKDEFVSVLQRSSIQSPLRDLFVPRIQQDRARVFRTEMIESLKKSMEYTLEADGTKLKTSIDNAVGAE